MREPPTRRWLWGWRLGFGAVAIFWFLAWGLWWHRWLSGALIGGVWLLQAIVVPAIFERRSN